MHHRTCPEYKAQNHLTINPVRCYDCGMAWREVDLL